MRFTTVIEVVIIIALIAMLYVFLQEPDEDVFYSSPGSTQAPAQSIDTPVPLIEENARWGKTTLSIFIDLEISQDVPGFRGEFIDIFRDAADTLSNSIQNKITFRFVSQPSAADIHVRWVEQLRADSLDAIGHTELNFSVSPSFSVISKAEVELLAKKEGGALSREQMFVLSMHEIGHALGLGHSESKDSIMYPEAQESLTKPSPMDVESILEAYGLESLPDLYVKEAQFSKRIINRVVFKQYLYDGKISVINDGLSDSGLFLISIEADGNIIDEEAKKLRPGESIILTLQNVTTDSDFSEIIINVDKENDVRELNEDNRYRAEVG
ncbi:MAG: matrixin family metalloprotease [Candidatus Aenigmarchaeota archaeon]|nr:matrixin family metalloprotease [Candidatus Aenigmarchaeota archaeon]